MRRRLMPALAAGVALLSLAIAAGCGGGSSSVATPPATTAASSPGITPSSATGAPTSATPTPAGTATSNPGALSGEAASVATGDIPDNQVFLTFANATAGYSIKYAEGWAQKGSGNSVILQDKNNIVRILVSADSLPSLDQVRADMAKLTNGGKPVAAGAPQSMQISGAPAVKVSYSTISAPNPVTGKSTTLLVDRYYLSGHGKLAVVDLGTPKGVDNVDAYRLMIQSFRWK
jgi:hypothetical protein